jgi:HAD superfamily hydrolase (TIGR01490 family)
MTENKTIIAAFDFDGTLTTRDSLLPFLIFSTGFFRTALYLFVESPSLLGYLLGIVPRQKVKESILNRFFQGIPKKTIERKAQEYAWKKIDSLYKPHAIERLQWHLKQGHRCLIISASIDLYLNPWCEKMGLEPPICSRLEFDAEERVTGKLIGMNCWGPEKVRRLKERLGAKDSYILYAYGDSRGDHELLDYADHPFYRKMR